MAIATLKKINLQNIIYAPVEYQESVRNIRNEEQVRRWMYSDHIISKQEHNEWINKLVNDVKNIVFIILNEKNEVIGVISINALDTVHKKADWAYYLTETARSGVGAVLEFYIIEYVFNSLKLCKLNCEVIEHNDTVVRMHQKFGFKIEGFRESNILKGCDRLGVHYLGLTKERWIFIRDEIKNKYNKFFSQYQIKIL